MTKLIGLGHATRETKNNGVSNPTPITDGATCKLQAKFGVACLTAGVEQCGANNSLCTTP